VRGDLVVRGDGDPSFSRRFWAGPEYGTGYDAPVRALARRVAAAGVKHVTGDLVADASAFPASSGVNPMVTVMALAHHTAQRIKVRSDAGSE
jgi:D-alanyl-D-alanine carboxypeptidase